MEAPDWIELLMRAFFCFTGIIGNGWLGLRSLPRSGSPLRTSDVLFVNLAVSNLITNCLVDLPETMAHVAKSWLTSKEYCGVTKFSHEISETSSIFSTMFISMYWHQKLVGSIRRGGAPVQMDNLRLVVVLLAGSWIVSTAFSLPYIFIAEHNANESSEVCEERFASPAAKQTYDGMYLTLANVVPMIGITYATVQIVLTLLRSQKRVKDHSRNGTNPQPSSTQLKSNPSSSNQVRAAKSVVAVATIFIFCWFTHLILRIYSTFRNSILAVKLTNFIGASYVCFVPYVYLHGVKKLNCSWR
ncbi:cardioacceleratory peptide receptor-like [Sinocyclocheilus anshuiensis]|uniref:cardioacceleratory peptide receptor-like n=1 Tax=Sinocyclocheilus anshuiensis TaxID=1608454 RepID=UPI0007B8148A|nr:PREDICTED: cardioacceleratory peptide receptor-like [Sinocyclocheilus anshuiensis]